MFLETQKCNLTSTAAGEGHNYIISEFVSAQETSVLFSYIKNIGENHKISFQITLPENTTHIVICTAGGSVTQSGDTKREVIKTVVKAGNNNQGKYGSLADAEEKYKDQKKADLIPNFYKEKIFFYFTS